MNGWRFCFFLFLFFLFGRMTKYATDGFDLWKLASANQTQEVEPESQWPLSNPQRFTYFGKGGQSYVFASEDGQWILKFFRKRPALNETQQSVQLAQQLLQEETGLIHVHLNRTSNLPSTKIVDKLQIEHTIDLNTSSWILQKRATMVKPYLAQLMARGDEAAARKALHSLSALIKKIREKGVGDADCNLVKNFGFIDNDPIQIDVGRFYPQRESKISFPQVENLVFEPRPAYPEIATEKKLEQSREDLLHWLNAHYPDLSPHLESAFPQKQ